MISIQRLNHGVEQCAEFYLQYRGIVFKQRYFYFNTFDTSHLKIQNRRIILLRRSPLPPKPVTFGVMLGSLVHLGTPSAGGHYHSQILSPILVPIVWHKLTQIPILVLKILKRSHFEFCHLFSKIALTLTNSNNWTQIYSNNLDMFSFCFLRFKLYRY